jgi:hypothetical protein
MSASGKSSNRLYDERREATFAAASRGGGSRRSHSSAFYGALAAAARRPSTVPAPTREWPDGMERECFKLEVFGDNYQEWVKRTPAHLSLANVISSHVPNAGHEQHAPALDLDNPALLTPPDAEGVSRLMMAVRRPLSRRRLAQVINGFLMAGLIDGASAVSPHPSDMRWYQRTPAITITLNAPAVLLPSSTAGHHHLYISKTMPWDVYCRFMKALVVGRILERGFYRASRDRGHSDLRAPWITKGI